jgi:PAS domain S-box-containing protein
MNSEKQKSILLVEDEVLLAMAGKKNLENYGYTVVIANTGEEAIEVFHNQAIDLVLMDIDLGDGIDGTQAAEIILQDLDVPILFQSSHTEPEIVEKTEKITAYGYVVKNSGITILDVSIKMAFKLFEANRKIVESEEVLRRNNEDLAAAYEEMHAANEELEASTKALIISNADLEKSQKRYHLLFNNLTEGFALHELIFDENGNPSDYRFLDINPAFEQLTGLTREDTIGKGQHEVLPNEDPFWFNTYCKVALTGEPIQLSHYSPSLKRHYEVYAYSPIKNQFAVIFKEVTNHYLVMEALKESEEQLKSVLEGSKLGFWDWNIKTGEVQRNNHWAEMLGYTLDEINITVEQWTDLIHRNDREKAMLSLNNHLEGHSPTHQVEYRMLTKDKKWKWIYDCANVVKRDEQGKPIRMSGTYTDITERKQTEEALLKSERKLEAILQTMVEGMVSTDLMGQITYCNKSAEQLLDINKNILGKYFQSSEWNQIDEQGNPYPEDQLPLAIALRERRIVKNLEHGLISSKGEWKWLSVNATPLIDDTGLLLGGIASYRDITENKLAEKQIKSLLVEIEIIVKEEQQRMKNSLNNIYSFLSQKAQSLNDPIGIAALNDAGNRVQSMIVLYEEI